jgi:ribosome maturation factor RimP
LQESSGPLEPTFLLVATQKGYAAQMADELTQRLITLFTPAVEAEGMELYHVDLSGQPGRLIVRIYLDKEGGVNLGDCATMSRTLGTLLDVDDPIMGRYSLEVSSPGLDRPLVKPAHFVSAVNQPIKLRTHMPIGGKRRNFEGILKSVDVIAGVLELETESGILSIPLAEIKRANLVYVFEDPVPPGRKGSPK